MVCDQEAICLTSLRRSLLLVFVFIGDCRSGAAGKQDILNDFFGAAEWLAELSTFERSCIRDVYPQRREDLAHLLNCLGLNRTAVEVGVQTGVHAEAFLQSWSGERLLLVDKWQEISGSSYIDIANMQDQKMASHRRQCEDRLRPFGERAEVRAMWSIDAAGTVPDSSLDFVYLDARHDFCGVLADIVAWWPKLKRGGIFAGHDFCDGEMPEGDFFVRSATAAFFGEPLPVLQTWEWDRYRSFFVVKTSLLESRARDVRFEAMPPSNANGKYYPLYARTEKESLSDTSVLTLAFLEECVLRCSADCRDRVEVVAGREEQAVDSCVGPHARGYRAVSPDLNEKMYSNVCSARCRVTCEQRLQRFMAIDHSLPSQQPCGRQVVDVVCASDAIHRNDCLD